MVFLPTWFVLFGQLLGYYVDYSLAKRLAHGTEGKEEEVVEMDHSLARGGSYIQGPLNSTTHATSSSSMPNLEDSQILRAGDESPQQLEMSSKLDKTDQTAANAEKSKNESVISADMQEVLGFANSRRGSPDSNWASSDNEYEELEDSAATQDGVKRGAFKKYGVGGLIGDGFQMPGAFMIQNGQIQDSFVHQSVSDQPDYDKMLNCCVL